MQLNTKRPMDRFSRTGRFNRLCAAGALILCIASCATSTPAKETMGWGNECLGYYTLGLPADFEYGLVALPHPTGSIEHSYEYGYGFSKGQIGLGLGDTRTAVVTDKDFPGSDKGSAIHISAVATEADLNDLIERKNREQQKKKNDHLESAKFHKEHNSPNIRLYLQDAAEVAFFKPILGRPVFGMLLPNNQITFHALINGRIVTATRQFNGSPEETLATFLSHYHPRALFEVPDTPGVCLPHAFVTGEQEPAFVALFILPKDYPDIVVELEMTPTSPKEETSHQWMSRWVKPGFFYATDHADGVTPLDKPRNIRSVTIDGRQGSSVFVLLKRDEKTLNNAANNNEDWGYVAYVPGDPDAPRGTSFDIMFKIERFGRFAKQPMTEAQFRDLVKNLASGIKRRPGSWKH